MRFRFQKIFSLSVLAAFSVSGPLATIQAQPSAAKEVTSPFEIKLPYEKYTLDNGLEVILHEDHHLPSVAVNVWYHVGSKDEPQGKSGFAHLFEHVMFQGSRNVGEDMFFKYLERVGASDRNGTTSDDRTNYYETVPTNGLELVLWLESDRMGFLLDHANQKTFESQREVVKNERRQTYENAPYGLVYQFVRESLYPPTHPYHRSTIGTPEDLDAAKLADVQKFFRTYYVPNNATLAIAGDLDRAKTKELVAKYFGSLPRGETPKIYKEPIAVKLEAEKKLAIEAEVELPMISINWLTPPHFAAGDSDLDLLAHVLSNGKSSRLYKRLVYDMQVAQHIEAYQESEQLSSTFTISVTLRKGKNISEVLKVVDEELNKVRTNPPTPEEIERAKSKTLSSLVFSMERMSTRANMFNEYNQKTKNPGYFSQDLARYEAASPESIQKAATMYLVPNQRVVAIVTPTPGAPRAGRLVSSNEPKK